MQPEQYSPPGGGRGAEVKMKFHIGCGILAAVIAAGCRGTAGGDEMRIPKEPFGRELQVACSRLNAVERTPRTVVFSVISDLHTIDRDIDTADPGRRNTLPVIEAMHRADALADFDFFADLGDIGLELPENRSPEAADALMRNYAMLHRKSPKPTLICMGNHDTDRGRISHAQFGDVMNRPEAERFPRIHFGEDASFGYLDLPEQRVRVFFLNSGRNYTSTEAQNAFLREKLAELSGDWLAVYLMHYAPTPAGRWVMPGDSGEWGMHPSMAELAGIIEASPRSAVVLCGDSHFDAEFHLGRVPGFITQGYGGIDPAWMPPGARRHGFDSSRTLLAELVMLIPETRQVRLIRAGAGGAEADRSAEF